MKPLENTFQKAGSHLVRRLSVRSSEKNWTALLIRVQMKGNQVKIAQFIEKDRTKLGIIMGELFQPIDFEGDMVEFITNPGEVQPEGVAFPLADIKLAPPVSQPSKIIAIGLNYLDHASEGKAEVPKTPLLFAKFSSSVIGSGDFIRWTERVTRKVDFEAELAVVVGKKIQSVSEKESLEAVFGYTCANDVSARDLQFGDGQWVRGKSLDTFCPTGPWIVTSDEIVNPQGLKIQSYLNGELMQSSNTANMIFPVASLIAFLSRHFTLFPGDLILTGTPSGVGVFREPSVYMKDGDEIVISIEGIGELKNRCRIE